jgi:hypothetical protein
VEDANDGNNPTDQVAESNESRWSRFISYPKRKFYERKAKKEKESPTDRAARITATATVWIAAFTVVLSVVGLGTLYEIYIGGSDTHDLAQSTLAASRAWIVVQGTGFGFTKDKNFPTGRVVLADSGNSPAFGLNGWRCVEVRSDEPPIQDGQLQKSPTAVCLPVAGGTLGKGVPIQMDAFIPAQVPADFSRDTEGSAPHFYYWGIITYDIYPSDGKRHSTSFCLKNGWDQLSACRERGIRGKLAPESKLGHNQHGRWLDTSGFAAAVVRDGWTVPAVDALIEMPAQGGGATARDGSQHREVLPGDPPAASFDEGVSRGANQIGHLKRRPVHLRVLRWLIFQLERVQRTCGGVEMPSREMEIDRGF